MCTSTLPPNSYYTDTPRLWQIVTSRKVRHKMELSTHMASYLCVQMGVQLKSKLQHNGTRSAAT